MMNVIVTAKANLISENAVLKYSGTATASQQLPSMTITPKIWRQEPSGDSLGKDWTFADCHHEYWVWGTPQDAYLDSTHIVYSQWQDGSKGYNDGRLEFYNDLVAYSLINSGHPNDVLKMGMMITTME